MSSQYWIISVPVAEGQELLERSKLAEKTVCSRHQSPPSRQLGACCPPSPSFSALLHPSPTRPPIYSSAPVALTSLRGSPGTLRLQVRKGLSQQNFAFKVPQLKVGTLDQLMVVSELLGKADSKYQQMVVKLSRTFAELGKDPKTLLVGEEGLLRVSHLFQRS